MISRALVCLGLFLTCAPAGATAPFLSFGYGRGGDGLSGVTGGQDYNTHAGDGLALMAGVLFPVTPTTPHRFEAQLGVGYMFQDDDRNKDNSTSWSHIPFEATYFYRNTETNFRIGWGLTYQIDNHLSAKGANASAGTRADNALGWLLTAEKLFPFFDGSPGIWGLGARYTIVKYHSANFRHDVDGNALSLTFSATFF